MFDHGLRKLLLEFEKKPEDIRGKFQDAWERYTPTGIVETDSGFRW